MDALQLANTAFAVDMFKKLCEKDKTANIIFAPLCTSTSLALAYKATKGDTADQMKQVSCQHPVLGLQSYTAVGGGALIYSCYWKPSSLVSHPPQNPEWFHTPWPHRAKEKLA